MITDIFSRRYASVQIRDAFYREDSMFLNQAATTIVEHLWPDTTYDKKTVLAEAPLKEVHDLVALELGLQWLSPRSATYTWNGTQQVLLYAYKDVCKNFLIATAPSEPAQADGFIKDRLSFIEQAYRYFEAQVRKANAVLPREIAQAELDEKMRPTRGIRVPGSRVEALKSMNAQLNANLDEKIADLNERLRIARYPLSYHNGLVQVSIDSTTDTQIAKPFWALVSGPAWANVDEQIKEAIDRRDNRDRTAAFHAVCALESTIKIISDMKGWTRGNEKGAANYIDNLVSAANGRFVEVWEGDALKAMFSDVRNPFAHGPGQAPMPTLTPQQTDWAIDTAMAWTKSLVRRM
jgi:AbiJ N-terminal domain 4